MRKMTKWICALFLLLLAATSCSDKGEAQARQYLENAQQALTSGKYNEAKILIDSLRILYPRALEARKEGIRLMQQADLAEQQRTLHFLDSTLTVLDSLAAIMKPDFVLEKDTAYQEVGNYFHPSQVVEKNIYRSFLRAQTDEKGKMTLTSIYCGERNANHHGVKVTAADGTFAETPASEDIYRTSDLGWKVEKADYSLGADGGVIAFVAMNHGVQTMKVEYLGERLYVNRLRPADSEAILKVYKLSQLLSSIEEAKAQEAETERKIAFVERKMKE